MKAKEFDNKFDENNNSIEQHDLSMSSKNNSKRASLLVDDRSTG
jgi:hypothetical protein